MVQAAPLRYLEARPPAGTRAIGTLVLLHAFPFNARMWEPQFALANGAGTCSRRISKAWTAATVRRRRRHSTMSPGSVVDLLDTLHIESAVIGGVSMGGYMAFALYKWAARYFAGMVLADTRPDADTPQAVEGRRKMLRPAAREGTVGRGRRDDSTSCSARPRAATRPDLVEHVRSLVLSNPAEAIAGALTAIMTRGDSTPLLAKIDCPVLVIVGEEDVVTPPALSREMHYALAQVGDRDHSRRRASVEPRTT